jgi:hypothetical protein
MNTCSTAEQQQQEEWFMRSREKQRLKKKKKKKKKKGVDHLSPGTLREFVPVPDANATTPASWHGAKRRFAASDDGESFESPVVDVITPPPVWAPPMA